MDNMKHRRLQELDRSDFEIVKDEPDIRGWDVRTPEGKKIGEVEELIIDAQKKKVRYMVVELDDDDLDLEDDRKVLIPIGLAELHKEDDDVLLPAVSVEQLKALPAYDSESLDDDIERRICAALGRLEIDDSHLLPASHTATEDTTAQTGQQSTEASPAQPAIGTAEYYGNFYQHAFFNDYNLYKNREQEANAESTDESEYERGLRLWELRSEGGIISTAGEESHETGHRDLSDEKRRELVQHRRQSYVERQAHKKSIIQRIKDEGLQDA